MKKLSKILSIALCLAMVLALFTFGASATTTWTEISSFSEVGAGEVVMITMTSGSTTYTLSNAYVGSKPTAVAVSNLSNMDAATYGFTVVAENGGYALKAGNNYLNANANSNASAVNSSKSIWTIDGNYLKTEDGAGNERWLGVYNNADWRAYKKSNGAIATNISGQTLKLYKATGSIAVVEAQEKTIAEIVANGTAGTLYKTTGKVSYIKGSNVYVQDGTSALCLYFASAPSGLTVGDVITAEGSYKLYNGLPELEGVSTFTKTTGKDYTVKETTISALNIETDIAIAVKLNNLTLRIDGENYYLSDGTGELQWYKPAIDGLTLSNGDTIVSFNAIVGVYKTTLQLINDDPSDLIVCDHTNWTWEADADSHWKLCSNTDCGAIFDECAGTPTVEKNDTQHWTECICGYESTKVNHDFGTDYVVGTTGHYQQCACGQKTTEEDHADGNDADELCDKCDVDLACPHTSWKDNHDAEEHWSECEACGTKKDVAEHTLTTEKDQNGHWGECECGYASEKVGHTMTNKNDKDNHWGECECGYASEKVKHTLTFKNDDKQHWSVCDCGYVSDKVNHKLTNNKCECGFEKPAEVKGYSKLPITKPADVKEGYYVLGGAAQNALDNGDTYSFLGNEPDAKDRINGVALNGKNNVVTPTGNAQVWQFIASGNGFKIKNVATGKYLYYKGSSNAIYLTDNEAEAGIWVVTAHDNGFGLQDSASGRFLGVNRFGKEGSYYLGFAAYNLSQYVTGAIDLYVADANAKPTPNTGDGISAVVALLAVSGMGLVVMTAKKKEN